MKKFILCLITVLSLLIVSPIYAIDTSSTTTKSTTTYSYKYTSRYTLANKTGARLEDNSGYTETCVRNSSNNYGVKKKWDMNNSTRANYAMNTPCVDPNDMVYDFSDILTEDEEIEIKEILGKFSQEFDMAAIFVSYNLPYTDEDDNENFIADFYDFNDFSLDKNVYDGIAIFRNTYSLDPYIRIMTFGNAQMYLYDTRYDSLISNVGPYFRDREYERAVKYTLSYYRGCYEKGALKGYYIDDMGYIKRKWYPLWGLYTIVGVCVSLIYMFVNLGKHKMVKKSQAAKEYIDKASVDINQQKDIFVSSHTTSWTESSSSGGGGGGHHSSGGHSGGGHSSGGGHF